MHNVLMTGTSRHSTGWLCALALGALACGSSAVPRAANSGSGGAGQAGHFAGNSGSLGAAGKAGATGVAGKNAASGGVTGSAGRTAGSGGVNGVAGNAGHTVGGGSAGAAANSGDDAGVPPCAPCIEGSVSWGNIGGLVAFSERSTLDACNVFTHTRSPSGRGSGTMLACQRSLPCMGSGLHGVSDVLQALKQADVQAALAKGHALFGSDPRPVDGTVFEIVARAGTSIEVGDPCAGSASCAAIPAGVSALANLLRAIDNEQLSLDPCRSMFQP